MSTKEAVARVAEELQDSILEAYRDAIATGEPTAMRRAEAAERLLSRVYGRPKEHVETELPKPAIIEDLEAMSADEQRALLTATAGGKRLRLVCDHDQTLGRTSVT